MDKNERLSFDACFGDCTGRANLGTLFTKEKGKLSLNEAKHKWFLLDNGKYECLNCHRVFTKQEVSIAKSLQNSSDILVDPVPILQCVKKLEERERLEFEGTPQELVSTFDGLKQRTTEEAFVVKVKIPYGSIIDLEHRTFDTLHYAGEVLSLKLLGIDSDGFLFFECRMRKSL